MKNLITYFAFTAILAMSLTIQAATCKYKAGDIGPIEASGTDTYKAYRNLANKCFDRRLALHENVKNSLPEGEQADAVMLSCANIPFQCQ